MKNVCVLIDLKLAAKQQRKKAVPSNITCGLAAWGLSFLFLKRGFFSNSPLPAAKKSGAPEIRQPKGYKDDPERERCLFPSSSIKDKSRGNI